MFAIIRNLFDREIFAGYEFMPASNKMAPRFYQIDNADNCIAALFRMKQDADKACVGLRDYGVPGNPEVVQVEV